MVEERAFRPVFSATSSRALALVAKAGQDMRIQYFLNNISRWPSMAAAANSRFTLRF
jgi:hypothetical protein